MEQEGVIKYRLAFRESNIRIDEASLHTLNQYRSIMLALGLMGQDNARYEGYGFGNISLRCLETNEAFWISGSQTGHLAELSSSDVPLVTQSYPEENTIVAQGLTLPSSESMTHAVIYQQAAKINAVIHVHSPDIWLHRRALNLVSTPESVTYGTPEMAKSVAQLVKTQADLASPLVFGMDGHEDGVVVAGENLTQCASSLKLLLEQAKACS